MQRKQSQKMDSYSLHRVATQSSLFLSFSPGFLLRLLRNLRALCVQRSRIYLYALVLLISATAQAETPLPTPTSLRAVAAEAAQKGEPLVVLVSLPGCVWCEMVRRSYLAPMRSEGLSAWQITVNDSKSAVQGFDGKATTQAQVAQRYQARLTPTVLFLGPRGQELAERISGVASPDFYGAVLDDRLVQARKALLTSAPQTP